MKNYKKIFTNKVSSLEEINQSVYKLTPQNKSNIISKLEYFISLSLKNKNSISKMDKFLKKIDKNNLIILDGANIGYYKQGIKSGVKIDFLQLKNFIDNLYINNKNILLVLNQNHFNNLTKKEQILLKECEEKINIFKTPRGVDDDLYWLYISLYIENSKIVSNDEITNHLYYLGSNILKDFRKNKFISYDFINNKPLFKFPSKNYIHMYLSNNLFITPYNNDEEEKLDNIYIIYIKLLNY